MSDIYLKKKMLQICIIAKDCYRLNENWAHLLGKKMAGLSRYEGDSITCETEYMGKMYPDLGLETNTFDLAANGKSIQFEIMAALNGPSEWYQFMEERGRGIHHIAFAFAEDDFDKGLADLKKNTGMDRVQKGSPYATPEASYAYLNSKPSVGTTLEILGFGNMGAQAEQYRQISALMSGMDDKTAPLAAMIPADVTLIVEDIGRSLAAFVPLFHADIPPVQDMDVTAHNATHHIRTAQMDMDSTMLRFLQPVQGENYWKEFSDAWHTGLFSIAYEVQNLEEKTQQLEQYGFSTVQSGTYADGTAYVLLDGRQDYGTFLELRSSPTIRERFRSNTESEGIACHAEYAINERTPLKDIFSSPHCCTVWEQHFPGSTENMQANMAIAYRMPLGLVLKMSAPNMTKESLEVLLKDLNG